MVQYDSFITIVMTENIFLNFAVVGFSVNHFGMVRNRRWFDISPLLKRGAQMVSSRDMWVHVIAILEDMEQMALSVLYNTSFSISHLLIGCIVPR